MFILLFWSSRGPCWQPHQGKRQEWGRGQRIRLCFRSSQQQSSARIFGTLGGKMWAHCMNMVQKMHCIRTPRYFLRHKRFPEGETRGKSRESKETSRADQEIHPCGQGRIDSVKINPSLLRMRECWMLLENMFSHLWQWGSQRKCLPQQKSQGISCQ